MNTQTVRVAMLAREPEHLSLRLYRDAMAARLPLRGIALRVFSTNDTPPTECDVLWDPGLGMRNVHERFFDAACPVVVTVLGLRAFAVPVEQLAATETERNLEDQRKREITAGWERLKPRLSKVIAISRACAGDIEMHLGVPLDRIHAIHLAVDRETFSALPGGKRSGFLHVALGSSTRKNLGRILEAYDLLPHAGRIPFLLKLNEDPRGMALPKGVWVKTENYSALKMAELYRSARAYIFPSIYEGFGLPIVEAMSCGCPVITSNRGACAEVAGGAALLVDPLSTREIADAMQRVMTDDALAADLAHRGIARVRDFSWDRCADEHAILFRRIVAAS